jgi:hypothetical protein
MSDPSGPHVISHQTVRLGRGNHPTPEDGACVMELASMLAGERFTDHPKSVCRVIASFLRAYNDAVDDRRRQDLYPCAASVVGTRGSRTTERARLARCERELADLRGRLAPSPFRWIAHGLRALDATSNVTGFFTDLARELGSREGGHHRALALVDELVAIEVQPAPPCHAMSGRPDTAARARQALRS